MSSTVTSQGPPRMNHRRTQLATSVLLAAVAAIFIGDRAAADKTRRLQAHGDALPVGYFDGNPADTQGAHRSPRLGSSPRPLCPCTTGKYKTGYA
jgi:hypothetical protein